MCIMNANVEFICWPTKVPLICKETFHDPEGKFRREYYRFVSPRAWLDLRKICNPK